MNAPDSSPRSSRRLPRWLVFAVILGLTAGLLSINWWVSGHRRTLAESVAEQRAIVTLSALTELVAATQGLRGNIHQAVTSFADGHPDLVRATVINFSAGQLLSSTDQSLQDGEFPRRLTRQDPAERALHELSLELRAAMKSNQRRDRPPLEEISVRRLDNGHLALAALLVYGRKTPGLVEVEVRARSFDSGGVPILAGVLILVGPVLFWSIGSRLRSLGMRLGVGLVIVASLLGVYLKVTLGSLSTARQASEDQVATWVAEETQRLSRVGPAARFLRPENWHVDRFRRPRAADLPDS